MLVAAWFLQQYRTYKKISIPIELLSLFSPNGTKSLFCCLSYFFQPLYVHFRNF